MINYRRITGIFNKFYFFKVFLLILIFYISPIVSAQIHDLKFDHLSIEDGLSQGTVNCVLKDHQGFMWFGTNDGLNKYDGYKFTIYRHNSSDTNSISDNKIYSLLEDHLGNLWVGTRNGLNLYNRETDRFTQYKAENENFKISNNIIRCLFEDRQNRLWVGTLGGGLNIFDEKTGNFKKVSLKSEGKSLPAYITSIIQTADDKIYIAGTINELISLSNDIKGFTSIPIKISIQDWLGKTLFEDSNRILWICTEGDGLLAYNPTTKKFTKFTTASGLSNNIIKDIHEVRPNIFWIATDGGGLNIYDKNNNSYHQHHYDITNPFSLGSNAVYTFYQDNQGIIWIGTYSGGINIYNRNKKQFYHYTKEGGNSNSLSHRSVLSLLEDESGEIYVGTGEGGLNIFDPDTKKFRHFINHPSDPHSISSNVVTSLYKDKRGNIWVGTYAGGLNLYNKESSSFKRYVANPNEPLSLGNNNVWDMLEDDQGRFLIATLGGLFLFDRDKETFTPYLLDNADFQKLKGRITVIFEDSKNNLWIGGSGLVLIKPGKSFFFKNIPDQKNSLSMGDIRAITEDNKGRIWIGTEGGGLNLYNPHDQTFTTYDVDNGLPNNAVHSIIEDTKHNLWLSTNMGISKFNPGEKTFRNYDINDGLQSNEFSYAAGILSKTGHIYFGGINGFNYFHPDSIRDNPHVPPVVLTDFRIFNKSVNIHDPTAPIQKQISQVKEITLPYNKSFFTIEFTALNFTSPQKNEYAYLLEGFNEGWSNVKNQRTATYTNLDPGDYIFRVKASNNDGKWNEEGASVKITILPPFWKTKWAYFIYALLIVGILLSYRNYSLDRARLKHSIQLKELEKQKVEEVNQLKLRFFTNISHEFRTPLTLILGPLEKIIQQKKGDSQLQNHFLLMHRNANRLLHLVNQLLDFRNIEKEKIRLEAEKADLVAFIKDIIEAFQDFTQEHGISLTLETSLPSVEMWFDKDKMDKILFNLLSNACKFTPDNGVISVKVTIITTTDLKTDLPVETVEISVEDSGIGISQERVSKIFDRFYKINHSEKLKRANTQEGSGIGLALTKELVEMHHGKISVSSQEGKGSCFRVHLPLKNDHYKKEDFKKPGTSVTEGLSTALSEFMMNDIHHYEEVKEISLPKSSSGEPQVLVIDDNSDLRQFIHFCLDENYIVEDAADGMEGWEKATEMIPDVIISDLMMPHMNGFELLKKIKADERTNHIPVIILTAFDTLERNIAGLEIGADEYLAKPFNSQILELKIKNILEAREKIRKKIQKDLLLQPSEITIDSAEDEFIKRAVCVVENHISDTELGVGTMVKELGISRSVLYRKFKAIANQSINDFILLIRLRRASQLLSDGQFTISEVAYEVGFSDPQYFSKCFRKQFEMTPSEFIKSKQQSENTEYNL